MKKRSLLVVMTFPLVALSAIAAGERGDWDSFSHELHQTSWPSEVVREWVDSDGELMQEVAALKNVRSMCVRPYENAYEHTLQVVDRVSRLDYRDADEKRIFLLAAVCHDLGEASFRFAQDDDTREYCHAERGVRPAEELLRRLYVDRDVRKTVGEMVRYHMHPKHMGSEFFSACYEEDSALYRRLAGKLDYGVTLSMMVKFARADMDPGISTGNGPVLIPGLEQFERAARRTKTFYGLTLSP